MELDEFFKFKIGEFIKRKSPFKEKCDVLYIVGRNLEQCPGGIQHYYNVRHESLDGVYVKLFMVNEIEVEAYDHEKGIALAFKTTEKTYRATEEMKRRVRHEIRSQTSVDTTTDSGTEGNII